MGNRLSTQCHGCYTPRWKFLQVLQEFPLLTDVEIVPECYHSCSGWSPALTQTVGNVPKVLLCDSEVWLRQSVERVAETVPEEAWWGHIEILFLNEKPK